MTFVDCSVERNSSISLDFPVELSKNISDPVELSDIEDIDGLNEIFGDSPTTDSDTIDMNDVRTTDRQTEILPNKRMSIIKQLEKLEEIANRLEANCQVLLKQTEEVEEEMNEVKSKGNEKSIEKQNNPDASCQDMHTAKLLHFIKTCLDSSKMDAIIQYTNKSKTEFKIIDPKKFAALWGKEKGKENLNERKLCRGLTYLITRKHQLKKVAKWKYLFLEDGRGIDLNSSRASSPFASDSFSPCSSELSNETSFCSTNCNPKDRTSGTPSLSAFSTQNPTAEKKTQRDSSSTVMDWLMKINEGNNESAQNENDITTVTNDIISNSYDRVASSQLLPRSPIAQQQVKQSLNFVQQPVATKLTITQESSTSQLATTQKQLLSSQLAVPTQITTTIQPFLSSDNPITSGGLETLTKSLTINPISGENNEVFPEINNINCYTYCINPTLLTSSFNAAADTTTVLTTPTTKTPCETTDDTFMKNTTVEQPIHFHVERPAPANNLIEMALPETNINMDIQYSTVSNIISSKDFQLDTDLPDVNEISVLAQAFSNESINFNDFGDNYKLFGEDLFGIS